MSVNRGDSMEPLSYSDLHVQHINHELDYAGAQDPSTFEEAVRQFEITERGLDPDEVAELVRMQVQAYMSVDTASATDIEGAGGRLEGGFNLSGTEFLGNALDTESNSPEVGVNERFGDTDEAGQLFSLKGSFSEIAINTTDGAGGGGGASWTETLDVNFRDYGGFGPVLDANDDYTSRIAISDIGDSSAQTDVGAVVSLWYNVHEVDNARPHFGL